MRIVLFAVVGLILGLGAGGGVGGMKTKGRILQLRADSLEQALADSALSATHGAEEDDGEEGAENPLDHEDDQPEDDQPDDDPTGDDPQGEASDQETEDGGQGGEGLEAEPAADHASPAMPEPAPEQAAALVVEALNRKTGLERLGKIFMAMKARDAAAVLTHLNDMEVEAILFELREKQAAEILGNFPPDRAAVLSRSVLQKYGGFQ